MCFRCVMCACLYLCVYIYSYPQLIFFSSYCLHIFQQGPNPFQCWPPFPSILSRGFSKEPSETWLLPSPKAHFQSSFAWDLIPLGYFLTHVAKPLPSHYSSTPALEKFFFGLQGPEHSILSSYWNKRERVGHNLYKNDVTQGYDINWLEPNRSKIEDESTSTKTWVSNAQAPCNTSAS